MALFTPAYPLDYTLVVNIMCHTHYMPFSYPIPFLPSPQSADADCAI